MSFFNGSRLTSQGGIAYTCFSVVRAHFRKPRPLFITFYGLSPFWDRNFDGEAANFIDQEFPASRRILRELRIPSVNDRSIMIDLEKHLDEFNHSRSGNDFRFLARLIVLA
jgi:hypothetical protein